MKQSPDLRHGRMEMLEREREREREREASLIVKVEHNSKKETERRGSISPCSLLFSSLFLPLYLAVSDSVSHPFVCSFRHVYVCVSKDDEMTTDLQGQTRKPPVCPLMFVRTQTGSLLVLFSRLLYPPTHSLGGPILGAHHHHRHHHHAAFSFRSIRPFSPCLLDDGALDLPANDESRRRLDGGRGGCGCCGW